MIELKQARLKELLDYDQNTGVFRRKVKRGGSPVGSIAGVVDSEGYRAIRVDGAKYKAHRLAFLWMMGAIPLGPIDHANMRRDDNSWKNLREATHSENKANTRRHRGKQLPKGVHQRGGRFRAIICKDGHIRHLGTYDTVAEAHSVYAAAAASIFGQFARVA